MRLIFLDTESTGLDLEKDCICEVCYMVGGTLKVERFKPACPMTVKAMSITHITDKMLADKPAFEGSAMQKELQEIFSDSDSVLVCHNAAYDSAMLAKEGVPVERYICTLKVARHLDGQGTLPEYNLQYLRYHHGIEIDGGAMIGYCAIGRNGIEIAPNKQMKSATTHAKMGRSIKKLAM